MGEEDTQRQALNVARMRMLGAEVVPVTIGSRTLKDAMNEAFRDWVTTVGSTHYCIGSVGGPHPFPMMVRDFQRVIGVEARQQVLETGGAAAGRGDRLCRRWVQRAWASSTRSCRTRRCALIGCEAGGDGLDTGRHAATMVARLGRGAARHAHPRAAGRRRPDARHPLDLRRPGLPGGRPRARLARRDRPGQLPGHHRHPGDGGVLAAVPDRGHHPGAGVRARAGRGASGRAASWARARCCW